MKPHMLASCDEQRFAIAWNAEAGPAVQELDTRSPASVDN